MSEGNSFWKELTRRRVVRVAMVYMAVGWAIFEGSDTLTSVLDLPGFTPRLVLALVLLGFPVAVVLAWAFQVTPDGVQRAERYASPGRFNLPFAGGVAVGVLTVSGLAFVFAGNSAGGPEASGDAALDEHAVAVLPFRVNASEELSYLGTGFMDLLAARLDGEVGPRAMDPGAVVGTAGDEPSDPLAVGRALGAGFVLTGSVVGGPSGIVVNAEYTAVSDGSLRASAEAEGRPESLTELADALIVELLSLSSGEYTHSIASLTTSSPDALEAYLLGKRAWRAGVYEESVGYFEEALALDTTFALAAIACLDQGGMGLVSGCSGEVEDLAWRHRDRLGPRDRTYLEAVVSSSEPGTATERIRRWERIVREQPDRVEALYRLGDLVFHSGPVFPGPEWADRVQTIWGRALELQPGFMPILDHLLPVLGRFGTTEEFRFLLRSYQENGGQIPFFRELAEGGTDLTPPVDETDVAALNGTALTWGKWAPVWAPDHVSEDFMTLVEAMFEESRRRARAGIDISLSNALNGEYELNLVLGRPGRAEAVREEAIAEGVRPRFTRATIHDGVWEGVAVDDAQAAVDAISARLQAAGGEPLTINGARDLLAVELWRHQRDPEYSNLPAAEPVRAAMTRAAHPEDLRFEAVALLIEAWAQVRSGGPAPTLERLVEIIREGPGDVARDEAFLLAVARVLEESGDREAALDMLHRVNSNSGSSTVKYATKVLRERGRLSALTGDTAGAIRDYRRWLTLHAAAEPSVLPEVEAVRAEVARLGG